MKHLKALLIKAAMIWAIVWIVLSLVYKVDFIDSTIVGVIIVVSIYIVGDMLILRKIGNIAATIADSGAAALILWAYLSYRDYSKDLLPMILISAVLIGAGEWFFHKWLLRSGTIPDERSMK